MIDPISPVILLSGGQDSTTCLALAMRTTVDPIALSIDYGQRNAMEIIAAARIAHHFKVPHRVLPFHGYGRLVPSALTRHNDAITDHGGFRGTPSTNMPGRNLVFATLAASYAVTQGKNAIVIGVSAVDYSGYFDCRSDTIRSLEHTLCAGLGTEFHVLTPLIHKSKKETVELARTLPGCWEALRMSITCYEGETPGCGKCPACVLRAKGFAEANEVDPAHEALA